MSLAYTFLSFCFSRILAIIETIKPESGDGLLLSALSPSLRSVISNSRMAFSSSKIERGRSSLRVSRSSGMLAYFVCILLSWYFSVTRSVVVFLISSSGEDANLRSTKLKSKSLSALK